jgi:photosystem II stability/assembly factor-like uncharacterized protein
MKRTPTFRMTSHLSSLFFSFLLFCFFTAFQQRAIAQPWMENAKDASGNLNFYKIQANFNDYWKNRKPEKGQGYKPFKRWEHYWKDRINKDGSFPPADITTGTWAKYLRDNRKNINLRYHQANWESLGPTTTPGGYAGIGRINAICFHPSNNNIIWVGSPSGGLWKSTDNGASWSTNTDNFTILGVSGIAINPNNPDIMYIATGDGDAGDNPSIGVLKSTDGGSTWNNTGLNWPSSNENRIRKILIDQNDVNTIMVASNQGVFVSNNAGASWTNKLVGDFWDIKANPTASTDIFYACNGDKIYKSTDNGNNWVEKYTIPGSFPYRTALGVSPADPNVLYALSFDFTSPEGTFNGLYKSIDAGETFSTQSTTPNILDGTPDGSGSANQGWYDLCLTVDPTNASIIYTGGIVTWKSTNSGASWTLNNFWYNLGNGTPIVHADKHVYEWQNNNTLWSGNDGGVYKTTNGGSAWSSHSDGLIISQMYRLGTSQADTKVITGLQDNGTKLRSTGGVWSDVLGGDGMECAINPENSAIMYACIQNGELHRSTNGGLSFTDIQNNIPGQPEGSWVTPYALDPLNPNTIYAGYDQLWKSTDQGNSWTSIGDETDTGNFPKTIVEVAPSDPNVIITGSGYELYKTLNGGTSWIPIVCPEDNISMLEIHPTNPLIIWASNQSYFDGKVFKSIDGGASWTNISGSLPNLPANCIVYDKNSNGGLYVGLDVGVYYRDNSMSDWVLFSDNLPNVEVWELDINYHEQKLYAATYGRGLWKSDLYEYAFIVDGNKTICPDFNWNYSVDVVPGAISYTWTLPSGWSGTSTTNMITVDPSSTSGTVQCVVSLPSGSRTYTLSVSVNPGCNNALDLDGTNDFLELPSGAINLNNTSFTVEFWSKRATNNTSDMVINQGPNMTNSRLHIGFRNNNLFTFAFYGNDLDAPGNYSDNQWHHWSCVYDKSISSPAHNRFIYRDGILVASDRSASDFLGNASLQIGNYNSDYFGGSIDELRIWNVARSVSDIQSNIFCPLLSPPASLKLYLPFEDGAPGGDNLYDTETIDFSGSNIHSTMMNMALSGIPSNYTTGVDVTRYADSDGDGFGNSSVSTTNFCTAGPYVFIAADCDDTNANIHPYSVEVCGNGSDDDCDGNTDVEVNKALNFGGSGHSISIPFVAHSSTFTAEMWIKTSSPGFQNLIQWTGGPITSTFAISGSSLIGYFEGGGFHGGINIADNVWHHLALVHNGYGSNNIKAYVDGVLRLEVTLANVITNNGTVIGSGFNGLIDDVRFWDTALTPSQIQSSMNVRLDGNEPNLIRYYPLDHGQYLFNRCKR